MSVDPFMTAAPVIQVHAIAATLALLLGPVVLYRHRRDRLHKTLGYIWVVAMAVVAMSSFGISGFGLIGPFSPLHLLALFALWSLYVGVRFAIAGNRRAHEKTMRNLYWRGVFVAGVFNFLPGRTLNSMFMDDARQLGWVVIVLGLCVIFWGIWREIRRDTAAKTGAKHPIELSL
ncbi:DUF2306 domain-containing protein [Celeribacter marinus]|uniref:DUF2306 domain-containing protein n=1 Tax=Celeribacter marinus TaxID=1397108 RepID=UPI00316B8701